MSEKKSKRPQIRFAGFTDTWEQRKLGKEFTKVNERNDGSFGKDHWISVAKMYFQDPEKVQSNNIDTRTYVMRMGDIAFEGHPNDEFKFGRFVANDIGDGVVSELFPIYRHKREYDNNYWKHAIQIERIMSPIFSRSITSSGNSSNKLDCPTARSGRHQTHFKFGAFAFLTVQYSSRPQIYSGSAAYCRSLV